MDIDSARRRDFLTAAGAAFTTSLFTGNVKGANDRVSAAFIGVGRMGQSNLNYAMKQTGIEVAAICDVYQPNLERAVAAARKGGHQPREVKDFREILADKSIDIVNISTPDHWHAYMTVEACKTGGTTTCNFAYSGALTEAVLLGNVAYRLGKPLTWDAQKLRATNEKDADRYIRKEYRKGWEL